MDKDDDDGFRPNADNLSPKWQPEGYKPPLPQQSRPRSHRPTGFQPAPISPFQSNSSLYNQNLAITLASSSYHPLVRPSLSLAQRRVSGFLPQQILSAVQAPTYPIRLPLAAFQVPPAVHHIPVQPPAPIPVAVAPPPAPAPLPNVIHANSFKQHPFPPMTYSPTLTGFINGPAPELGRIYKEEHIVQSEVVDSFTRNTHPCESQSFFYIYFSKKLLGDGLRRIPFPRFLKAIPYIGKGYKNRDLAHLIALHLNNGSNDNKLVALSELIDDGIIIQRNNNFTNEHLALNFEGGGIELLYEQLTNDKRGDFPGMELSYLNGKYVEGAGLSRRDPREFVFDCDMLKFGFLTLYRAYLSFIEQDHFIVTRENLKRVISNRTHSIKRAYDPDDAFSKYNIVDDADFSYSLIRVIDDQNFDDKIYANVWDHFEEVIPQQCFVYLILDGKKVPIPVYKQEDDYDDIEEHTDVLLNEFRIQHYLDSIVAIGIENDTERFYKMLKNHADTSDPVKAKIQELLNENTGIFVQTVFTMSSEDEALLRKAAMLKAICQNFEDAEIMENARSFSGDVIEDLDAICLKKSHKLFWAQPPSRLTKDVVEYNSRKRKRT